MTERISDERLRELIKWHRATDGHTVEEGCPGCDTITALRELASLRAGTKKTKRIDDLESDVVMLRRGIFAALSELNKTENEWIKRFNKRISINEKVT